MLFCFALYEMLKGRGGETKLGMGERGSLILLHSEY